MGSSLSIYMGSYIKISQKKYTTQVSINVCPSEDCSNHNNKLDSKFCPKCGSPSTVTIVSEMVNFSLWKLNEKYNIGEDDFHMPDCYYIIMPQGFDGYSTYEDGDCNILDRIPTRESLFQSKKWVKLIDSLTKENVQFELAYGVVSYWS